MSIIRDITEKAKKSLEIDEILLFVGARQSGKTTILKQLLSYLEKRGEKWHFINLEDPDFLNLLDKNPKNLFKIISIDLKKKSYVFIDEVQYLKNPSNFLKYIFDEYKGKIKILASGSSAFYIDQKFKDSLAGRKKLFNVKTLSFREFLRFKGEIDLSKENFSKIEIQKKDKIHLYFNEYLIYGGYPRVVLAPTDEKKDYLQEIAYSYIKKDILEANIKQSDLFLKLFKILAEQTGMLINASELANTLRVSKTTIDNFLYVMQKSFHIQLISPYYKNLRKELTKMPKVYFSDLGLRNFFTNDFDTYKIRKDKGQLLENACFRQLSDSNDAENIKYWRTTDKNEVDFVVNDQMAFEVKNQPRRLSKKNYQKFLEAYPEINFRVVSWDTDIKKINSFDILEVWEI